MKVYSKSLVFLLFLFITYSCRESIVDLETEIITGDLYIESDPSGADILFNDSRTGKVTPDSLTQIQPGSYAITVRLLGLGEETRIISLSPGQKKYIHIDIR